MRTGSQKAEPYFTYDEEPKHFNGEDVQTEVTRLQRNDRFRHRAKGWVTVTTIDVRRTRVKIDFTKDDGSEGSAFSPIDMPKVSVVRQTETNEHKLWRLEHELRDQPAKRLAALDEKVTTTAGAFAKEVESAFTVDNGRRVLKNGVDTLLSLQAERDVWSRLVNTIELEPRRYRYGAADETWTAGDAATITVWFVENERERFISEHDNSRSLYVNLDFMFDREEQRVVSRLIQHGGALARLASKASEVVALRLELKVDLEGLEDES